MAKEIKDLIIQAPETGISASAHIGYEKMQNLDIFSTPGIVKLNNILANASTTTVSATVKWIIRDPNTPANFYAVDSAGDVYVSTDSGATFADLGTQPTAGGAGQGLIIWKDYLFCPRATAMDIYGPLSNSPAWRNSWAGLTMDTDSLWHPMIISKLNGNLYGGAGKYVFSLLEVSGKTFDWDDVTTYTATAHALDLPADYRIKCLSEIGSKLAIGTWQGTAITNFKIADIFLWNKSSVSFENPIIITENGVNAMVNIGGYLYIQAGIDGTIYKSNGVQAWKIAQIPLSVADISNGKYLETYPGAMISHKGKLFFGVGSQNTAGMGVYSIMETSKGTILNHEHSVSTLTGGGTNPLIIGALLSASRDNLIVGYRDNTTYRIDKTNIASFAYGTDYSGYFISPLYNVGTLLNKRQFTEIEFLLVKELAINEGIKVEYRINLTDSWVEVGTWTTAEIGTGVVSFNDNINISNCEQVQIKSSLKGTTTTPEFRSLTLA